MDVRKEEFLVDNLKCGGCANTISRKLGSIPGVSQVQVDLDRAQVNITVDNTVSRLDLTEKLKSLGYPEQGEGSILETGKSYISCMMGRM